MNVFLKILLPFLAAIFIIAAIMLIVAAAQTMPFWTVIPLGIVVGAILIHEMSE